MRPNPKKPSKSPNYFVSDLDPPTSDEIRLGQENLANFEKNQPSLNDQIQRQSSRNSSIRPQHISNQEYSSRGLPTTNANLPDNLNLSSGFSLGDQQQEMQQQQHQLSGTSALPESFLNANLPDNLQQQQQQQQHYPSPNTDGCFGKQKMDPRTRRCNLSAYCESLPGHAYNYNLRKCKCINFSKTSRKCLNGPPRKNRSKDSKIYEGLVDFENTNLDVTQLDANYKNYIANAIYIIRDIMHKSKKPSTAERN